MFYVPMSFAQYCIVICLRRSQQIHKCIFFFIILGSAASKHQGQVVSLWSGLSKPRTFCLAPSHTMEHCLLLAYFFSSSWSLFSLFMLRLSF